MPATCTMAPTGRRTGVAEQLRQTDDTLTANAIRSTYDQLNRRARENARFVVPPSGGLGLEQEFTTDYTYDLIGNRLERETLSSIPGESSAVTYTCNANDQLVHEDSSVDDRDLTTYTYDPNGSLISKDNDTTSEHVAYGYNLEGRLSSADITRTESGQPVHITSAYQYNQSGIRTRAQSSVNGQATTRVFLNDAMNLTGYSQVLEEFSGTGLTVSFVHGDDEISQTTATGTRFFQHDGHQNVRGLTDGAGTVTDRYSYDAWGNMLGGNPGVNNPTETSRLFSGEEYCGDLQWNYHRARYYDMAAGVWNQMDPFEGNSSDPQSLHKYAFCHGDGVNGEDPSGEQLGTLIGLVVAVSLIAVVASVGIGSGVHERAQRKSLIISFLQSWDFARHWDGKWLYTRGVGSAELGWEGSQMGSLNDYKAAFNGGALRGQVVFILAHGVHPGGVRAAGRVRLFGVPGNWAGVMTQDNMMTQFGPMMKAIRGNPPMAIVFVSCSLGYGEDGSFLQKFASETGVTTYGYTGDFVVNPSLHVRPSGNGGAVDRENNYEANPGAYPNCVALERPGTWLKAGPNGTLTELDRESELAKPIPDRHPLFRSYTRPL